MRFNKLFYYFILKFSLIFKTACTRDEMNIWNRGYKSKYLFSMLFSCPSGGAGMSKSCSYCCCCRGEGERGRIRERKQLQEEGKLRDNCCETRKRRSRADISFYRGRFELQDVARNFSNIHQKGTARKRTYKLTRANLHAHIRSDIAQYRVSEKLRFVPARHQVPLSLSLVGSINRDLALFTRDEKCFKRA